MVNKNCFIHFGTRMKCYRQYCHISLDCSKSFRNLTKFSLISYIHKYKNDVLNKLKCYFRIWKNYNKLPLDGGSDFLRLWVNLKLFIWRITNACLGLRWLSWQFIRLLISFRRLILTILWKVLFIFLTPKPPTKAKQK